MRFLKNTVIMSVLFFQSPFLYSNSNFGNDLNGTWTCTNYSIYEDHNVLEIYNITFSDKKSYQNGALHFTNSDDEAVLKYQSRSNFVVQDEWLEFKNYNILSYTIDNLDFDRRYKISETFNSISPNEPERYKIDLMTHDQLIYRLEVRDFDQLAVTSNCVRVNSPSELPEF